jgi:hypothetical protein
MSTYPYQDEYRIHPSDRDMLPGYMVAAIDRHHAALVACRPSTIEIEITQDPQHYSVSLSADRLVISTSLNGETDTVTIDRFSFEARGGIGDIILTLIEGGALPKKVEPTEMTSTAPSP